MENLRMGIHDREYYRSEHRANTTDSSWTMVTRLIVVTVGLYVLDLFIGKSHWLMEHMAATQESLVNPLQWWQLLTYGFAHSTLGVTHIFWNMVGLWFFGRQIEDVYGPKEFLRIYLVSMFLGGLAWAIRAQLTDDGGSVVGASGAVTAITLLFCIHFPKQTVLLMMVLPVPAWVLGVIIIGGNLIGLQVSGENVAFDVHLVGAAFAIAYYRFGWNLSRWWPSFAWPGRISNPFSRQPKLRVHRPHEDAAGDFEQLEAQADQLLEKVNRDGFDSLTERERQILENYSRRMRNKRR
jgi:membrane associated rhomboid family serine protease